VADAGQQHRVGVRHQLLVTLDHVRAGDRSISPSITRSGTSPRCMALTQRSRGADAGNIGDQFVQDARALIALDQAPEIIQALSLGRVSGPKIWLKLSAKASRLNARPIIQPRG
jgi:hypothetical protein